MEHSDFLFQAFVYLAAAVVTVPLAKRFGLGSVLGYLLAGTLIGPHLLGLVGGEGEDGVMHFAEFGVVMMLFLIGLELKPSLLWRLRVPILGMGSSQVLLTAGAVFGLGLLLDLPWRPALALGLVFSLSSTAIVLQSLQERKWLKSRGGQAGFSVLLFQDIAVIPMLALLPLLATREPEAAAAAHASASLIAALPAWQQALAVLGAGAVVILGGRFLARPAFRFIAGARVPEVFTAFALFLVIGIALLMRTVGLSPALGAFLAGVVLAESEYRHELEGDIEPFKGLLLGLFFLSVGASIDFPFIFESLRWILGATALVVVLKFGVLMGVAAAFRRNWRDALLFALALSQVGEFAFVLLALADSLNVLSPTWTRGAVAVTVLSMMTTPALLLLLTRLPGPREKAPPREMDSIEPAEPGRVILAGFGRMGNIIGRFLQANGVPTTVLDVDAELVDGVRKVGLKAWYGDASRLDMLRSAGADNAELLIITLSDTAKIRAIGELVRKHFPHLRILARSKRRVDAYELINAGFPHVYRETLGTSIEMGTDALRMLGFRAYHARRSALAFRRHNEAAMRELAKEWGSKRYFAALRAKIEEAENLVRGGQTLREQVDAAWDNEALREEAAKGTLKR